MSHPSLQEDGPVDANSTTITSTLSQLRSSPQDSPTIGRHSNPSSLQSASDSGKRSQRRAAPSPLQTSTTPTSPPESATPTETCFDRIYGSPSSSNKPSLPDQPRSPKEQLDDLLALERSFYRSEESSADFISDDTSSRRVDRLMIYDTNVAKRSVSDPIVVSKPPGSSAMSARLPMASSGSKYRADIARGTPRTSSIDSAISSVSGGNHSHKSSQDMQGTPDIANLIQAAGSPEAVIQYLLKEKSSSSQQNAQLWRLVDKQRAMILGLNKDLERALKDKERYRKKLKETLAQESNPSPAESHHRAGSDAGSSIASEQKQIETVKASKVEALVAAGLKEPEKDHPDSPIDVALAPYPITPPGNPLTPALDNMVAAEHRMPSPTQHAFQQYNSDAPPNGFEAGQQQRKAVEVARDIPYNASVPPSRSLPSDPPRHPPPNIPPPKAPMSSQTPSVSVIEPSPNPDEGLHAFPSPPRKAPPAPLNLGNKNASSHLRQASGANEESDSDYDDILEVDEIPTFTERGRRKTREEDDREREIAAMKDAEARSLSKKCKSSKGTPKSKPTTPKDINFPVTQDPMPTSARQLVPISPPDGHLRQHLSPPDDNTGSLAGILSDSSSLASPPLMSPGLPTSPRPIDRPMNSPMPRQPSSQTSMSPPMSPRGMGALPGAVPLSPRAPRQPIPLPPNTPMSISSPAGSKGETLQVIAPHNVPRIADPVDTSSPKDGTSSARQSPTDRNVIYRGLVTDEYPDLLLPPNALPSIDVKVASSRLKPSRASIMFPKSIEEDPVFTLSVFSRSDGKELWRVEKDTASLAHLDHILKQSPMFTVKAPDRSLFSGHSPAKVDARRLALNTYLDEILNTQMDTGAALNICRYLSTNAMDPNSDDLSGGSDSPNFGESQLRIGPGGKPLKNGYLTKRGKNFGGWKARFFVLDGPILKYYESPGGPHLGAIKLQNAQIGKQQQHSDNHSPSRGEGDDPDNQYRHAFLILEPKRKDSSSLVRHVLCAESDQERDQWVAALLQYVDFKEDGDEEVEGKQEHHRTGSGGSNAISQTSKKKLYGGQSRNQTLPDLNEDHLRGISYENTKPGNIPHGLRTKKAGTSSPPTHGHERDPLSQISQPQSMKNISGPKNAQVIQDSGAWGNKNILLAPEERIKQKKRSFFGFGSRPRASSEVDVAGYETTTSLTQMAFEQHGPIRPVFGAPLGEAVRYNHPADASIEVPAVVYRCIEYLDAKNAAGEEGIFRLSGSNVVIKQLRERFNTEGDVNLITDDQYYDIHAVASLLKLYLRELPTTILTRELHLEFLAVTELDDVQEKVSALNGLVHRLPRVNNTLLSYLSGFLINIINHSDTNKMTVRNVGIVFSPTLNIPAPVFALFLQQYDGIFGKEPDSHVPSVEVTFTAPPLTPEDVRSPRRQKFQDLPTPSYNQQSFDNQNQPPQQFPQSYPQGPYDTGFTPLNQKGVHTMAGPEYGRTTQTLAGPAYDQFNDGAYKQYGAENPQPTTKSKRRESSMFGMGMGLGPRKPSNNRLRDDSRLVDEESYFE